MVPVDVDGEVRMVGREVSGVPAEEGMVIRDQTGQVIATSFEEYLRRPDNWAVLIAPLPEMYRRDRFPVPPPLPADDPTICGGK